VRAVGHRNRAVLRGRVWVARRLVAMTPAIVGRSRAAHEEQLLDELVDELVHVRSLTPR